MPNVPGFRVEQGHCLRLLALGLVFISVNVVSLNAAQTERPCPVDLKKRFEQQSSKVLPWNTDKLGHQWAERKKYFLIIGVTEISDTNPDKKPEDFALVDAKNVAEALCDFGYAPLPGAPENSVLRGSRATRENVLTALEKTAQIPPYHPLLILYYSGHGIPDTSPDDLYLPFYDSKSLTVTQSQSLKELLTKLRSNYAGDLIVVLDACFSGTATVGKVLNSVSDFEKTAILASSSLDEFSYPIIVNSIKQSAFTHFFLQALRSGGDLRDGITTLGDAHLSVTASLLTQRTNPNLPLEEKLPGPMTPKITGVGIPRMVAYSRENIRTAQTTRRFVYSLEPEIVSAFKLETLEASNLPSQILVFSRGHKLATYSVKVEPDGVRSLIPTEIAEPGIEIDVTNVQALGIPRNVGNSVLASIEKQPLSVDDLVAKQNRIVKFDPKALDHQIAVSNFRPKY